MTKKIFSIILSIALLFILKNYSNAANATIQCSSEAKVNSPLTISVSGSAVQWNLHLKVNGQTIASNNEVENVEGNKTISFSGTYTPTSEGNITVTLDGSATEASDGSTITSFASKTVSVKKAENNNNSNNASNSGSNSNPTTQQQPQTKSNVATLANLGIKGQYDFTGFKSSKTAYSVTVPNEAESVEIYATKGQSGQKITGTGVKQLNEGANTVNVVVTAEDGKTTKTYTINIERKASEETAENPEESTEETSTEEQEQFGLKELKIEGIEITPEFKTDVYKYTAKLNENKTRLELITTPTVENAEIEISGNEDLKDGENIITIIVKEKDTDKTATYQITVNKILDEQRVTNATINKIQLSKKKMILLGSGVALLLIIIITIIVIIKRKKKVNNSSDEYYYSQLYSSTEAKEENISKEVENDYEEQPKKTRHSKGKRFK